MLKSLIEPGYFVDRRLARGRTVFEFSRPALSAVGTVLRLLPPQASRAALVAARNIPTKVGVAVRYVLVRRLARHCGDCVAIYDGVHLLRLAGAELGDHVSIHPMCYVDATGGLVIGSDVSIAHGSTIMTTEHEYNRGEQTIRDAPVRLASVHIGSDVWIGAGVRILAGVKIGDHCVIGAGAVVTRDIPDGSLAVGVPARPIKRIGPEA